MSVTADQDWVKAAMSDDAMVVDLLVRLNRPTPPPPLFPLHWTVRQRRSRSTSLTKHNNNNKNNNNNNQLSHRNSPTTPLSWSGGGGATSFSGGGGEESFSHLSKLLHTTRSKVNCDSDKTPSKRPKKKKTLAQLKEEETLLVKERRDLNREITALRMKLERERATNGSLKRIKLNLKPDTDRVVIASHEESVSGQFMPSTTGSNIAQSSASNSGLDQNADARFVLPDLNMPFDDSSSDVACGVS